MVKDMIKLNKTEVSLDKSSIRHFKETVTNVITYCRANDNDTEFISIMMASDRMTKNFGENLIKIIKDPKLEYKFVTK